MSYEEIEVVVVFLNLEILGATTLAGDVERAWRCLGHPGNGCKGGRLALHGVQQQHLSRERHMSLTTSRARSQSMTPGTTPSSPLSLQFVTALGGGGWVVGIQDAEGKAFTVVVHCQLALPS